MDDIGEAVLNTAEREGSVSKIEIKNTAGAPIDGGQHYGLRFNTGQTPVLQVS